MRHVFRRALWRENFIDALRLVGQASARLPFGVPDPVLHGSSAIELYTGGLWPAADLDLYTLEPRPLIAELFGMGFRWAERPRSGGRGLWHPEQHIGINICSGGASSDLAKLSNVLTVINDLDLMSALVRDSEALVDPATADDVGLSLAEAKSLIARLQDAMVRGQMGEYLQCRRMCPNCFTFQPVEDRRRRRLQTLFGTVDVEAPRFRICRCRRPPGVDEVTFSPVSELLPDRCTPEFERIQAEVVARTSFREGARILQMLLPASPAGHVSIRNRLHSVAQELEVADAKRATALENSSKKEIVVALDGAHVRSVPGYQVRHFEAITGKVEVRGTQSDGSRSSAAHPAVLVCTALADQGWQKDRPVTVISDGDPALPAVVGAAAGGPVTHILDWFHISMRVRHIEQAMQGLKALDVQHRAPLDYIEIDVERLRKVWRFAGLCEGLRSYIWNNHDAMIDYGRRWRKGKPISMSRAESLVNDLVNARMNKRRQMRWSLVAHIGFFRSAPPSWTVGSARQSPRSPLDAQVFTALPGVSHPGRDGSSPIGGRSKFVIRYCNFNVTFNYRK